LQLASLESAAKSAIRQVNFLVPGFRVWAVEGADIPSDIGADFFADPLSWNVDVRFVPPDAVISCIALFGHQWLIIQGRAVGKLFAPLLVRFTSRDGLVEQQPQPEGCDALYWPRVLGALALRSLVAWALRLSEDMQKKFGAVRITRGDSLSHFGQSCGASHSAIGRMSVNGPQSLQRYSYTGI
jgi:hypothetical protein